LDIKTPEGMVWVKGKTFTQGAKVDDKYAMIREKPADCKLPLKPHCLKV